MNLKLLFSIKKNLNRSSSLAFQYEDILIEYLAFILVQISFNQTISLRQLVPRLIKYPSLWETVQHFSLSLSVPHFESMLHIFDWFCRTRTFLTPGFYPLHMKERLFILVRRRSACLMAYSSSGKVKGTKKSKPLQSWIKHIVIAEYNESSHKWKSNDICWEIEFFSPFFAWVTFKFCIGGKCSV